MDNTKLLVLNCVCVSQQLGFVISLHTNGLVFRQHNTILILQVPQDELQRTKYYREIYAKTCA